ncbi:MAG TPA: glycosyltransferase [Desulfomonilaceae bacterium]|nr:glycosyltransferase [Desulfomonilaceae bacterium]
MRILHVLHRSVPGTHGYAIRSREIVTNQLAHGLEPIVITSPSQAPLGNLDTDGSEIIDGIRYFRTCSRLLPGTTEVFDPSTLRSALRILQNAVLWKTAMRIAGMYRPAVIHAHSPFTCGIIGDATGKLLKIPTLYEVRGIWEDSHTSRHGLSSTSLRYRAVRGLENLALRGADSTCTICEALKSELESRGVNASNISVVPNGVDVRHFHPGPPGEQLKQALGLQGKTVMGYIGSFFHYEGLDLLVQAMGGLAPEFPDLSLLLVGDGEVMPVLKTLGAQLGISQRVVWAGKVPHDTITDYYRVCDFMVLPRKDTRETRLVTPLKPLEIMSMARPLIASDIGGHREIIEDGMNGILFEPESLSDLVSKCSRLVRDEAYRAELGAKGRSWVETHRDWDVLVLRYIDLYEKLVERDRKRP